MSDLPESLPELVPEIAPEIAKDVDAANAAPHTGKPAAAGQPKGSFWLDFGPLLIFYVVFQYVRRSDPDGAMLVAAGVFAVAAVIALAIGWVRHKRLSPMLLLSTGIIVITAGLALLSGNKTIFYMKPTIVNALFGIAAISGALMGKNVIRLMVGDAFTLPDRAWNSLAIRWGLFFFAMAALNEVIWRTQTEVFWANFKLFGFLPLTIVFTLSQIPFIKRHGGLDGLMEASAKK